jgi:indolepyruvate ferredoxin oxidoreductase alpha subunit
LSLKTLIESKEKERVLLMGNEAIARGALEAGVSVAAGYPGTPSS